MAASGLPAVAFTWLEAMRRRNADEVWRVTDPQFRLCLVQIWILANYAALQEDLGRENFSRDELAEQLAQETPSHPFWQDCARVTLRTIHETCEGALDEELGIGSRPRLLGPGLELVRFMPLNDLPKDEHGAAYLAPGGVSLSVPLIMSLHEGGWRVAGVGHHLLHPGWPPSPEEVVSPDD